MDAVFYRRHRSEESHLESSTGEIGPTSGRTINIHGSYGGTATQLILRPYFGDGGNDILSITGSTLVRTTQLIDRTVEERYDRR
jgi:hypothetical protein